MNNSNLPPGVSASDIPGNTEEDMKFEEACLRATELFGKVLNFTNKSHVLGPNEIEDLVQIIARALLDEYEQGYNDACFDNDPDVPNEDDYLNEPDHIEE